MKMIIVTESELTIGHIVALVCAAQSIQYCVLAIGNTKSTISIISKVEHEKRDK